MAAFRRCPQSELDHLRDQELVDYLDAAREAEDNAALKDALGYLAFRFEGIVKARVVAKVPAEDVEDVTMEVLKSIVRGGFDGKLIAEFGAWVRTVTRRRIADYHRERERQPRLDSIDSGDDERTGPEPIAEEETATAVIIDAVERVLAGRSELHQRVIRLYGPGMCGFEDLPAAEVCERLAADGDAVTADNVAQIWSRFKRDLRKDLDA
jgi:RNA polymerase sigma factor (sigma-70 family)